MLTGELIVKHKILTGKGNKATIEVPSKIPKIYTSMLEDFKHVKGVNKFLHNMASNKPRYIVEQCRLLKKIFLTYERSEVLEIIRRCNSEDKCDVTDVLSYLIVKHGLIKAKPILPARSSSYYKDKASVLSKYDLLVDDEANGEING